MKIWYIKIWYKTKVLLFGKFIELNKYKRKKAKKNQQNKQKIINVEVRNY